MSILSEIRNLAKAEDDRDDVIFGSADQEGEPRQEAERRSFFSEPESVDVVEGAAPAQKRRPKIRIPMRELRRQADELDAREEVTGRGGRAAPADSKAAGGPLVASPERYTDGGPLANALAKGRTVILNLEKTNKVEARRLLDFMSGAAFVLGGYVKRISGLVYIVLPDADEGREADAMSQMENTEAQF